MDSTRSGAYKMKLRGKGSSSTASRRKSRGVEQKSMRSDELNKRRNLATYKSMSPVAENLDDGAVFQIRNKRGQSRQKAENVMDRLKQWREEKKRQMEKEKLISKSKPMFKVCSLDRGFEYELFSEGTVMMNKKVTSPTSLKKSSTLAKLETGRDMRLRQKPSDGIHRKNKPIDVVVGVSKRKKNEPKSIKVEQKKIVPSTKISAKSKDPTPVVKNALKMQRSTKSVANLATKFTASAVAKINDKKASPKKSLRATRASTLQTKGHLDHKKGRVKLNISDADTPDSLKNIENVPRSSHRSFRRSTVISVSDEGTAIGRDLEPALAYKLEKAPLSAKASRILKELVIEKVDGEKSFFETSFDDSMREGMNGSVNCLFSKSQSPSTSKIHSTSTSPFTPRKSNEVTNTSSTSTSLCTPKSARRTRHSMTISSGFKEPGLPLSALRKAGSQRRKTEHCTPSKTPEQMINILKKSPMIEMARRRSRVVTSPAPTKGQYFRDLVTTETDRLTALCKKWTDVTEELNLSEEVLGKIRCAIGMSLLLTMDKFKQFSGLIDNYVYGTGERETRPSDLEGFWEMINSQIIKVDSQFKELDLLQQTNWKVKVDTPKAAVITKKKVVKAKPKAKGVKSNFAAFRAELLKKKAAHTSTTEQDTAEIFIS